MARSENHSPSPSTERRLWLRAPLGVIWGLLGRGGFSRSHRLGVTVVDHSPVQVDEFAAINADERREEPTILAGSIIQATFLALESQDTGQVKDPCFSRSR